MKNNIYNQDFDVFIGDINNFKGTTGKEILDEIIDQVKKSKANGEKCHQTDEK